MSEMKSRFVAGVAAVAIGLAVATGAHAARLNLSLGKIAAPQVMPGEGIILAQSEAGARFNRLEAQVRNLTGQVEELQFRLRQLQEQIRQMQGGEPVATQGAVLAPSPAPAPVATQPDAIASQAAAVPAVSGGSAPLDLSALARNNANLPPLPNENGASAGQQTAALVPTGAPRSDYQRGYNLIVAGNFAAAEGAFRQFLAAYPRDQQASDAQFWIGESYFARGFYQEAADEFLAGYKTYPDSAKGPDSLLKLGLSLAGLGERDAACSTYAAVLKQYPQVSNALRQRVISERAVASC